MTDAEYRERSKKKIFNLFLSKVIIQQNQSLKVHDNFVERLCIKESILSS